MTDVAIDTTRDADPRDSGATLRASVVVRTLSDAQITIRRNGEHGYWLKPENLDRDGEIMVTRGDLEAAFDLLDEASYRSGFDG